MGREPAERGGEAGEKRDALSAEEVFEEKGFESVKEERREVEGFERIRLDEFDPTASFDCFVLEPVVLEPVEFVNNDGRKEVGLEEKDLLSSFEGVGGRDLSFRKGL